MDVGVGGVAGASVGGGCVGVDILERRKWVEEEDDGRRECMVGMYGGAYGLVRLECVAAMARSP